MDLQDGTKILQIHIGRGCGSENGYIFQKLHPKQAVCQHCLFQPGAVIWRGEEELQKGDGPYQDPVRNGLGIEMAQQVIQGIDADTVPAGSHKAAHDKAV